MAEYTEGIDRCVAYDMFAAWRSYAEGRREIFVQLNSSELRAAIAGRPSGQSRTEAALEYARPFLDAKESELASVSGI